MAVTPTAKDIPLMFGKQSDSNSAVFDLAGSGLAQCCEIVVDNSVCVVYNLTNTSGIRRIACQIG